MLYAVLQLFLLQFSLYFRQKQTVPFFFRIERPLTVFALVSPLPALQRISETVVFDVG
jgi:hypothetical protein